MDIFKFNLKCRFFIYNWLIIINYKSFLSLRNETTENNSHQFYFDKKHQNGYLMEIFHNLKIIMKFFPNDCLFLIHKILYTFFLNFKILF